MGCVYGKQNGAVGVQVGANSGAPQIPNYKQNTLDSNMGVAKGLLGVAGNPSVTVSYPSWNIIKEELQATHLDSKYRDPPKDDDLSDDTDDGYKYLRGGHPYSLPYVCERIGIKVIENYSDDVWLGQNGNRNTYLTMPSSKDTIRQLKVLIQQKLGVNTQNQCLRYQGILLENTNTLKSYNITNNSTIRLFIIGTQGGSIEQNLIDSIYLDPHWDRDYTNLTGEHIKQMRGGYQYYRPCGWKRIAIKVLGKYSDDKWLGRTGAEGEWAVTYHGTKQPVFEKICEEGYKVGPGAKFGRGVYSSPDINLAKFYATQFLINGVKYLGIFQNRVNPKGVKIEYAGKYWVCPDPNDIRPYGLCVKRC
ncbi:hypothetical protein LOD99_15643 [Oopsacas minuta]|uniref:Ubiquitin-like domain-containing protein n=1 Tax=Oopsacas minuta TaxID=111878 RepID=A0AAV7KB36_9METZ|nr:hypothetical protein LOD99_15643 [Oopsacas minuta]